MSKERDLLGRWYNGDLLPEEYMKLMKETKELLAQPEPLSFDDLNNMLGEAEELLAQPEQEPLNSEIKIEWYGKGFRKGISEIAPPKPLTEDVIYALDKEGIVENMDDHQVRYVIRWIRRVEKAHGIGGGE